MEEATVDSRKASSSKYQKGKKDVWKAKSGDKSGDKPVQDKSGDKTKRCGQCGQQLHKSREICKAKDASCPKC